MLSKKDAQDVNKETELWAEVFHRKYRKNGIFIKEPSFLKTIGCRNEMHFKLELCLNKYQLVC